MTGSGTLLDPYIIWDVNDLQNMNLDLTAYYELGQDIDASATVGWNGGLGFVPVGRFPLPALPFSGYFDGKGYKITNLTINRPLEDYCGLFGYTSGDGRYVRNAGLENVDITCASDSAGLIGFNDDNRSISNCWVTGDIDISNASWALQTLVGGLTGYTNALVEDCWVNINITNTTGAGDRTRQIGGLIGLIGGGVNSVVRRCYSLGTITYVGVAGTDHWETGGLAGENAGGEVSQCYSELNIVVNSDDIDSISGLVGVNSGTISNCYARGDITANGTPASTAHIAGFTGFNSGSISNVYSTGLKTTTGINYIGGLVGENWGGTVDDSFWDTETSGMLVSDGGTGKNTTEMKDSATFITAGWGFGTIWGMIAPCNDGYPCLLGVTSGCLWAPVVIPTVTTDPATDILQEQASLNGTLDSDGGEACECGFEWGLTTAYGNTTPTDSKTTGEAFSQDIEGLVPGFTYHFRAFATNSVGTGYGDDMAFTATPSFNRAHALSREEL